MTGSDFVNHLLPILARGDLVAARELLQDLDDDELRDAKGWFAPNARWCRELYSNVAFEGADHDEQFVTWHNAEWILGMCAIALCGPRTAADRIPWAHLWDHTEHQGEAALIQMLWDCPADWVAEFIDAASHVRLGAAARNVNGTLSAVVRAAATHHHLPCPTGATFLKRWLAGTPAGQRYGRVGMDLSKWLAVDPLMPDLLHHYLASGDCGDWPGLPVATKAVVDRDKVDRSAIVEQVLAQLTVGQRPNSQRVLAGILESLEVRSTEVPGGLDYLLGTLSTCHRGAQSVLLKLALAEVANGDQWLALTEVVAGRPEKSSRETLLRALKEPEVLTSIGSAAIASCLDVLDDGDDAAYSAKVSTFRASIGVRENNEDVTASHGLWELTPSQSGAEPAPFQYGWPPRDAGWDIALGSHPDRERVRPWLVGKELHRMSGEAYDGSEFLTAAAELLNQRKLLGTSVAAALEDLFLAGGLSQGWSTAVAVADLAAGAPKLPSGFADLVRLLVRYAPEVPHGSTLPTNLAALALGNSTSKSTVETRRLARLLSEKDVVPTAPTLGPRAPVASGAGFRGLWARMTPDITPLPSEVPIHTSEFTARTGTLLGLRDLLAQNFNGYAQSFADLCWWPPNYSPSESVTGLTDPDRVLAATLKSVERHGAAAVRSSLSGIEREYGPLETVAAIDAWAAGGLDVATFWELATSAGGPVWEHVTPRTPPTVLERFGFLRATESLLRADNDPILLALPTWRDGTLSIEDLLNRLEQVRQGTGIVGPIDLVQALHRLRPADSRWIEDVPPGIQTDPRFTDRGGETTWDATRLVKQWLTSGGLPPLKPKAVDHGWKSEAKAPIPLSDLAAWPTDLADDPWTPGPMPATVRLHPAWAERALQGAFDEQAGFDPRGLPSLAIGPLGVPFHDRLLALITATYNRNLFQVSPTLVQLARWGRLNPGAAAEAARGRHESGTLSLNQLVRTFEHDFEAALPGLWSTALEIASALSSVAKRPAALADLLRLLRRYAHEVPLEQRSQVPDGLLAFAESTGATKAHQAARELVAALKIGETS